MHSPDWKQLTLDYFSRLESSQRFLPVFLPPMTNEDQMDFLKTTGWKWTEEFISYYENHSGVGRKFLSQTWVTWLFVPHVEIPDFVRGYQEDWIGKTHPELAPHYYPFIDVGLGDCVGYLDLPGHSTDQLWFFQHEEFLFEPGQPWEEFLTPMAISIEDFLLNAFRY